MPSSSNNQSICCDWEFFAHQQLLDRSPRIDLHWDEVVLASRYYLLIPYWLSVSALLDGWIELEKSLEPRYCTAQVRPSCSIVFKLSVACLMQKWAGMQRRWSWESSWGQWREKRHCQVDAPILKCYAIQWRRWGCAQGWEWSCDRKESSSDPL